MTEEEAIKVAKVIIKGQIKRLHLETSVPYEKVTELLIELQKEAIRDLSA